MGTDRQGLIFTSTLAGEVIGNLHTVYAVAKQSLELEAGERRILPVYWQYPVTTTYEPFSGSPATVPGAAWGHAPGRGQRPGQIA